MIEFTHLTYELVPEVITLGAGAEIFLKVVRQITTVAVTVKARGIGICTRRANSSVLFTFESVHGLASITEALTQILLCTSVTDVLLGIYRDVTAPACVITSLTLFPAGKTVVHSEKGRSGVSAVRAGTKRLFDCICNRRHVCFLLGGTIYPRYTIFNFTKKECFVFFLFFLFLFTHIRTYERLLGNTS